MATNIANHENIWKFERSGSLDHYKYIISTRISIARISGSPIDQVLTPEEPHDYGKKDWRRNENSRYVHCTSLASKSQSEKTTVTTDEGSLNDIPTTHDAIWRIELDYCSPCGFSATYKYTGFKERLIYDPFEMVSNSNCPIVYQCTSEDSLCNLNDGST